MDLNSCTDILHMKLFKQDFYTVTNVLTQDTHSTILSMQEWMELNKKTYCMMKEKTKHTMFHHKQL